MVVLGEGALLAQLVIVSSDAPGGAASPHQGRCSTLPLVRSVLVSGELAEPCGRDGVIVDQKLRPQSRDIAAGLGTYCPRNWLSSNRSP